MRPSRIKVIIARTLRAIPWIVVIAMLSTLIGGCINIVKIDNTILYVLINGVIGFVALLLCFFIVFILVELHGWVDNVIKKENLYLKRMERAEIAKEMAEKMRKRHEHNK